ncbi:MAG TPA: TOBE domain-containing protein [Gemmatimonadota bacterium]|nr:TOBE domain-containing protein [Gemmatimonadota bacterium]
MTPKDFDIPDIPDIPGLDDEPGGGSGRPGGGGGRRRGRRWPWLVAGLVLGVLGTVFLPGLVRPYLPAALRGGATRVHGRVVEKGRDGERLLLTVDTPDGAMLATFHKRVPEIDLLVAPGDSVTLGVDAYRPFIEGPELLGVRKPGEHASAGGAAAATSPDTAAGAPGGAGGPRSGPARTGTSADSAAGATGGARPPADSAGARPTRPGATPADSDSATASAGSPGGRSGAPR